MQPPLPPRMQKVTLADDLVPSFTCFLFSAHCFFFAPFQRLLLFYISLRTTLHCFATKSIHELAEIVHPIKNTFLIYRGAHEEKHHSTKRTTTCHRIISYACQEAKAEQRCSVTERSIFKGGGELLHHQPPGGTMRTMFFTPEDCRNTTRSSDLPKATR